jgi:signal transduction histidine kinase/ligand-binding sensor domain-containing protein/DNA-binding response OmpR family regulator
MKRHKLILLLLVIPILSSAKIYFPQFTNYSIDRGLSQCYVPCIENDKYGFMWFGTYDGLNRFDGINFKVFRHDPNDVNSLCCNFISALRYDSSNNLWVGTREGLCLMNMASSNFSPVFVYDKHKKDKVKVDKYISTVVEDKTKNIFTGTYEYGLLRYDQQQKLMIKIPLKTTDGKLIDGYSVLAATTDDRNRLFVSVTKYGLCKYNGKNELIQLNSQVNKFNAMSYNNGRLFIGGEKGLWVYDEVHNKYERPLNIPEVSGTIHHLFTDNKGVLWIATETYGIVLYNPRNQEVDFIKSGSGSESLSSLSIYCVFQDRQKEFWIGTMRGGVDHWNSNRPQFHSIQNKLGNSPSLNVVNTLVEINAQTIWVGTDGAGIQCFDKQKNLFVASPELNKINALCGKAVVRLIKDRKDNIWICTYGNGVTKYNLKTKKVNRYTTGNSDIKSDFVWSAFEDKDGTIWIGSMNDPYLMHYDDIDNIFVEDLRLVNGDGIGTISERSDGNLMLGTFNGLVVYNKLSRKTQSFLRGITIVSVCEDANKNIWIATDGDGIYIHSFQKNKLIRFDPEMSFLHNKHIMSISYDDRNNIWITSNDGLYCYNTKSKSKASFSKPDGLQSNQFTGGAVLKTKDGLLFWGGINGLTYLNTKYFKVRQQNYKTILLDVKIMNRSLGEKAGKYIFPNNMSEVEKIVLPYDEAYLGFDFIAIAYPNSEKIKYAYFLEGVDKEWNNVGNNRTAFYSNLKEGEYIFRVRNTNNMGNWNTDEMKIRVIVLPPFYRTWWAYLFYTLIILGIARLLLRFQSKQNQMKQNLLLANIKEQQNKELMQMKEQFFINVSHELRTPLTLILPPIKDAISQSPFVPLQKVEMFSIYNNASRLLSLINQLLLFRKNEVTNTKLYLSEDNIVAFAKSIFEHFSLMAERRNIQFEFLSNTDELLYIFDKNKMEIILYNLLSNAFKFTGNGGSVTLQIDKVSDEKFAIVISDNGAGMSKEEVNQIFNRFYSSDRSTGIGIGLALVKNYVSSHHGGIVVRSEQGKGTTFEITLPFNSEYKDEEFEKIESHGYTPSKELEELMVTEDENDEIEDINVIDENFGEDESSILIVEDNDEIRKYIRQILIKNNWLNILEASNGQDGLLLAQKHLPDVVISDIHMELMDGKELCKQIKDNEITNHIYVILITADISESTEMKGLSCGADEYLTKPFSPVKLINKISTIFNYKEHLRQYFKNRTTNTVVEESVDDANKIFIDKCIGAVKERYADENFTVLDFAQMMNMSHSVLYKKIKVYTGKSINEFIRTVRLSIAAELILKGDLTLTDIAAEIGIYDIKYFRTCFKKEFGVNPSDYRKMKNETNK